MNATPQTNADHDSVPVAVAPRNLAEGSPSPHDLVMGQPAARERITALDAAARLAIAEETPVVRDPKATH